MKHLLMFSLLLLGSCGIPAGHYDVPGIRSVERPHGAVKPTRVFTGQLVVVMSQDATFSTYRDLTVIDGRAKILGEWRSLLGLNVFAHDWKARSWEHSKGSTWIGDVTEGGWVVLPAAPGPGH